MDMNSFIVIFTVCYTTTMAIVEVTKKYIDKEEVNINLIALCIGCVVGIFTCAAYYIFNDIAFTSKTIVAMICMGPATALASNLGYDKVLYEIKKMLGVKF